MQRNSSYNRTLNLYLIFAFAIVYEAFASMHFYLTPLIGVLFYYSIYFLEKEKYRELFFILVFSLYLEANRGLISFSLSIYFLFIYYSFLKNLKLYINCKSCLIWIYVIIGYCGYYIFYTFLSNILNLNTFPLDIINYIIFIISDSILVFLLS